LDWMMMLMLPLMVGEEEAALAAPPYASNTAK
jgi:hypothetical protein